MAGISLGLAWQPRRTRAIRVKRRVTRLPRLLVTDQFCQNRRRRRSKSMSIKMSSGMALFMPLEWPKSGSECHASINWDPMVSNRSPAELQSGTIRMASMETARCMSWEAGPSTPACWVAYICVLQHRTWEQDSCASRVLIQGDTIIDPWKTFE